MAAELTRVVHLPRLKRGLSRGKASEMARTAKHAEEIAAARPATHGEARRWLAQRGVLDSPSHICVDFLRGAGKGAMSGVGVATRAGGGVQCGAVCSKWKERALT